MARTVAGDIIYVCNGVSDTDDYGVRINSNCSSSTPEDGADNNRMALVAYPGASVTIVDSTRSGITNYWQVNKYWVISKLDIEAKDTGIQGSENGRIVGNKITDPTGVNADGAAGAIDAGADSYTSNGGVTTISNLKIFGNYIHDFGGATTSNKHHTMYLRIRSAGLVITAPEIGWNRLEDNEARAGLYFYDENSCGSMEGSVFKIHDNFVRNQTGVAFGIMANPCTDPYTIEGTVQGYNNIIVGGGQNNSGGNFGTNAINFQGADNLMDVYFYNNTLYGYSYSGCIDSVQCGAVSVRDGQGTGEFGGTLHFRNNIIVDTLNMPFSQDSSPDTITTHSNNLWYNGGDGNPASAPTWDTSPITTDPLFVNAGGGNLNLSLSSPAIGAGVELNSVFATDLNGVVRGATWDIGAYEYEAGEDPDTTDPTITDFDLDATSSSLTVPLSFTCTDETALSSTPYCATETDDSNTCSWQSSISAHTFLSAGAKTLYGFCRDLVGNIGASSSDTTTITLPAATSVMSIGSGSTAFTKGSGATTLQFPQ
jgi:hypothetical protein